jgi:hypothetical protein
MSRGVVRGPHGVDVTVVDTAPAFKLGNKIEYSNGDVFQYVSFDGARAAAQPFIVDKDFEAKGAITTTAAGDAPVALGVFADAHAAAGYGWIQRAGNFPAVELATSVNPDVELYTTATAGRLSSTPTVGLVQSLKNVGTATDGAGQLRPCFSDAEIQIVTNAAVIN